MDMAIARQRIGSRLGERESVATARNGRLRLALAALVVTGGIAVVSPSLAFDSDHDGVGDSVEVYEQGTDPSSPDLFDRSAVVVKKGRGNR
jgi:hypothetical protein